MNVLVYSGPEVLQSSVSRALSSLRSALYPNYTVQAITLQSLASAPWSTSCALLVFPAFRHHLSLPANAVTSVKSFVENGGAFLGMRAGLSLGGTLFGNAGARDCSLRFQDPATGRSVYCTFAYGEDRDLRVVALKPYNQAVHAQLLQSQAVQFEGFDNAKHAHVLARYASEDEIAAASTTIGTGRLALWGPHIEAAITEDSSQLAAGDARIAEERRQSVLCDTLQILGLRLPSALRSGPTHPLPQLLIAAPSQTSIVSHILKVLSVDLPGQFKGENDVFEFHDASEAQIILQHSRQAAKADGVSHVVVYKDGSLPSAELTPLFSIKQYYDDLSAARSKAGNSIVSGSWGCGEVLFYGEAVTSTQTLLDK